MPWGEYIYIFVVEAMSDNHTPKDKLWTNPFEYDLDFHHCLGDHTPQFGSQCLYSKWEFYMFFFLLCTLYVFFVIIMDDLINLKLTIG